MMGLASFVWTLLVLQVKVSSFTHKREGILRPSEVGEWGGLFLSSNVHQLSRCVWVIHEHSFLPHPWAMPPSTPRGME